MTPPTVALTCHPDTPSKVVNGVTVRVDAQGNRLTLEFLLTGDLGRLRIPAARPPLRTDGLWRHSCFEAFLRLGDHPEYLEFNFSPSGEWAAYAFQHYRAASQPPAVGTPSIHILRSEGHLALTAGLSFAELFRRREQPLVLALAAVVEASDGGLSYWSLRHPSGKPDFHHRDAFALTLET